MSAPIAAPADRGSAGAVPLPHRIAIIGAPGAGKTTLSRAITRHYPLTPVSADSHIWRPGWIPVSNRGFRAALRRRGYWIADSTVEHGAREMLERSELVIYLDYSLRRLLLHNLRRWLRHRKHQRAELPDRCPERFPFRILLNLLRGRYRRKHEDALAAYPPHRLVRLRSPRQLRAFVARDFAASAQGTMT